MTTITFSALAGDGETDQFGCSPTVPFPYYQRACKTVSAGEEGWNSFLHKGTSSQL